MPGDLLTVHSIQVQPYISTAEEPRRSCCSRAFKKIYDFSSNHFACLKNLAWSIGSRVRSSLGSSERTIEPISRNQIDLSNISPTNHEIEEDEEIPTETISQGILTEDSRNGHLIFYDLTQGQYHEFHHKDDLFDHLFEDFSNWEIVVKKEHQKEKKYESTIYFHWNALSGVETFSNKHSFYYVLAKENGGFFKLEKNTTHHTTYILDDSHCFKTNIREFRKEETFLNAVSAWKNRREAKCAQIKTIATIMTAVGIVGAFAMSRASLFQSQPATKQVPCDTSSFGTGRHLLSTSLSDSPIILTEEVSSTITYGTWTKYGNVDKGLLIASAVPGTVPPGVDFTTQVIQTISSLSTPGGYTSIFSIGDYAYASRGTDSSIDIISINSDLSTFNTIPTSDIIYDMQNTGNGICDITGANTVISHVDINDPLNAAVLGSISMPGTNGFGLASSGNLRFSATSTGLYIINATNPSNPSIVASLPSLKGTGVFAIDDFCFVGTSTGFYVVNMTNPYNPFISTSLPITGVQSIRYSNNLLYVGTSNGMTIVDPNSLYNPMIIGSTSFTSGVRRMAFLDNRIYVVPTAGTSVGIFDANNPRNLTVAVPSVLSETGIAVNAIAISDDYLIVANTAGARKATSQNIVYIQGAPDGGSADEYHMQVIIKNSIGKKVANQTYPITVAPVITRQRNISDIIVVVNSFFSIFLTQSIFLHKRGLPLSYNLDSLVNSSIPSWSNFNSITGEVAGTPSESGIYNLEIQAADSLGAKTISNPFNLKAVYGPSLALAISNPIARIGIPFSYGVDPNTFFIRDPNVTITTFKATNIGGSTLPSWLTFDSTTLTFSGTPASTDIGIVPISLTATDSNGISKSTTFNINVVIPGAPTINKSIQSPVSVPIGGSIDLSVDIFTDPNDPNTKIIYEVTLADGSPLHSWLSFNNTKLKLSGDPDRSDGNFYTDKTIGVKITGINPFNQASSSYFFNIVITGTTYGKLILPIAGPSVTALTTLFTIWKLRALCYNSCCSKKYRRDYVRISHVDANARPIRSVPLSGRQVLIPAPTLEELSVHSAPIVRDEPARFYEGQPFTYTFSSPYQIAKVKVLCNNASYPNGSFPDWLGYNAETRTIYSQSTPYHPYSTVPALPSTRAITIQACDEIGYILEETCFTKGIPNVQNDKRIENQDNRENKSHQQPTDLLTTNETNIGMGNDPIGRLVDRKRRDSIELSPLATVPPTSPTSVIQLESPVSSDSRLIKNAHPSDADQIV